MEELFEKVRYKDANEIGVGIVNMYDSLTNRYENDKKQSFLGRRMVCHWN